MFPVKYKLLIFNQLAVNLVSAASEQRNIPAEPGQDVTLTCGVPNNNKTIIVVKWNRTDLGEKHVLLYRDKQFDPYNQHPSFKNRVDLQDSWMKDGNVSLILKNVTTDDGGTYECRVAQRGTDQGRNELKILSIIYLKVSPAGDQDGRREDGGEKNGSVGLIVGLSVLLVFSVVVVFVVVTLYKRASRLRSNQAPAEPQQVEMSLIPVP